MNEPAKKAEKQHVHMVLLEKQNKQSGGITEPDLLPYMFWRKRR